MSFAMSSRCTCGVLPKKQYFRTARPICTATRCQKTVFQLEENMPPPTLTEVK